MFEEFIYTHTFIAVIAITGTMLGSLVLAWKVENANKKRLALQKQEDDTE